MQIIDHSSELLDLTEMEKYKEIFAKLDKDGNGSIDIKDLTQALKEMGVNESYAEV